MVSFAELPGAVQSQVNRIIRGRPPNPGKGTLNAAIDFINANPSLRRQVEGGVPTGLSPERTAAFKRAEAIRLGVPLPAPTPTAQTQQELRRQQDIQQVARPQLRPTRQDLLTRQSLVGDDINGVLGVGNGVGARVDSGVQRGFFGGIRDRVVDFIGSRRDFEKSFKEDFKEERADKREIFDPESGLFVTADVPKGTPRVRKPSLEEQRNISSAQFRGSPIGLLTSLAATERAAEKKLFGERPPTSPTAEQQRAALKERFPPVRVFELGAEGLLRAGQAAAAAVTGEKQTLDPNVRKIAKEVLEDVLTFSVFTPVTETTLALQLRGRVPPPETIRTNLVSPNVRRQQVQKIISSLDDKSKAVISKNELTAGRVYSTVVGEGKDRRVINFLEFGKGTAGTEGFRGSRLLFGVELGKEGKVISELGGFSIEFTNQKGTTRLLTNLIRTTKKPGLFTVAPREKKEFITFIEKIKSQGIDVGDFRVSVGEAKTSLIRKTEPLSKIKPKDLALDKGEAEKIIQFLEGKKIKVGEPFAESTSLAIERAARAKAEIKTLAGKEFKGIVVKGEARSVEGGVVFTKDPVLKAPTIKGKTTKTKIDTLRNKLSGRSEKAFDKLSKIDKLFLEKQLAINKRNPKTGLSLRQVKKRALAGDGTPTGGKEVSLKPSAVSAVVAKATLKSVKVVKKIPGALAVPVAAAISKLKPPKAITAQEIKQNVVSTDTTQKLKTKLAAKTKQETKTLQDVLQEPVTKTTQQVKQAVQSRQQLRQKQQLKQVQEQEFKLPVKPPIPSKFVPKPLLVKKKKKKVKPALKKVADGWIPLIKERGKFRRFSKPFRSREQALNFARWTVDNSTSRQYKLIVKAKVPVKNFSKRLLPATSRLKFRETRRVRGRNIPLKNSGGIERKRFGIDTPGEKRGLKVARALARRFPKKTQKIKPFSGFGGGEPKLRAPKKIKLRK